jgi:hypothetical protein
MGTTNIMKKLIILSILTLPLFSFSTHNMSVNTISQKNELSFPSHEVTYNDPDFGPTIFYVQPGDISRFLQLYPDSTVNPAIKKVKESLLWHE